MIYLERVTALNLFAAAEGMNPDYGYRTNEQNASLEQKIHRLAEIEITEMMPTNPTVVKELNPETIKAAAKLHQHRFRDYSKEEAISALKFLELTLLYGYYENLDLGITQEDMSDLRDFLIEKSLGSAQKIWDQLDTKKITRETLLEEIDRLQKRTTKVLANRILKTEHPFFRKYIDKALLILKGYAKQ